MRFGGGEELDREKGRRRRERGGEGGGIGREKQ